jgi:hypothetical protein
MNYDTGTIEDCRHSIQEFQGEECWGFPLTDSNGAPIPENKWHVWRKVNDAGWYHVIDIDSRDSGHLRKVLDLVYEEARLRDMGRKAYIDAKQKEQEIAEALPSKLAAEKFDYLEKENRKLTNEAMENFERGYTKPTNPTKQSIVSYPGQTNRTAPVVPITDKEGGLVTWEDLE